MVRRVRQGLLRRLATWLGSLIEDVQSAAAREALPRFGNRPRNLRIDLPRRIINPERMFLGDDVWLGPGSLLNALTHYPTAATRHSERDLPIQVFDSRITIGNRVTSTAALQIGAHRDVTVEDDVMFAANVSITDGLHGYDNADEPYKYQMIGRISPILIKRGSWIGQNVVILPGVTIGECAIVGANSVVTRSVPDRSIAVGAPARVVKVWDELTRAWRHFPGGTPGSRPEDVHDAGVREAGEARGDRAEEGRSG